MVCRCIYGMCTSSEVFWLDHMVLFLVFWEASVMSLTVGAPMNTPQQFKASLPPHPHQCEQLFLHSHSDKGEVDSPCGFGL